MGTFSFKGREEPAQGLQAQALTVTARHQIYIYNPDNWYKIALWMRNNSTCALPRPEYWQEKQKNDKKPMQFASAHAHFCYRCMRFRLTFLYKMMLFETIAFHSANEIGQS